ncbi:MAG: DUF484 family protein [Polaromonas sp.]
MNLNPVPSAITEDDIADFLINTPDFFERQAELLAAVQLSSGHGARAVSLQERQAGLLREKIKLLETRVVEMIRHGQENLAIAGKMQRWTLQLLQTAQARDLPGVIVRALASEFQLTQAAIKVWGGHPFYAGEDFASGVSDDARIFAASLATPYCGVNAGFEAAGWLPDAARVQSLALIALRAPADASASADDAATASAAPVLGLLVLGSPDAQRFHSGMGTEFLERLGTLAGAALLRLRQTPPLTVH